MNKRILICLISILSLLPLSAYSTYTVEDSSSLENDFIQLDTSWDFYWEEFVSPELFLTNSAPTCDEIVQVPSIWNKYNCYPKDYHGQGSGTYHLLVTNLKPCIQYGMSTNDLIGTAANVYCNGKLVYQIGKANQNWEQSIPGRNMKLMKLFADSKGCLDLVIQVSNRDYRKGGIWSSLSISETPYIQKWYTTKINISFLLSGALFAILLYHLFLFLFRHTEKTNLYLALFAFVVLLRLISADFSILTLFCPQFPYFLTLKFEYMALTTAPMLFLVYLYGLNNLSIKSGFGIPILVIGSLIGITTLISPICFANLLVPVAQVYMIATVFITLIYLYTHSKQLKLKMMASMTISIACIVISAIHDMFSILFPTLFTSTLLGNGVLIFFLIQSIITAWQQESAAKDIDNLTTILNNTNNNYNRFVPSFGKTLPLSFSEENLGTIDTDINKCKYTVLSNATILLANIRNFTSIIATDDGSKAFALLNDWIAVANSIITANGGYLVGLNGDQFYAIFPNIDCRVFECALSMKSAIHALCTQQAASDLPLLQTGIGIHFGQVVLGLVGSNSFVTPVFISSELETVNHIESLTRTFDKTVLVSGTAVRVLHAHNAYKLLKMNSENTNDLTNDDIYSLETRT